MERLVYNELDSTGDNVHRLPAVDQDRIVVMWPHDAVTGATIHEQTRQCLANTAAILEEAGSSLDKIVSATVVLADEDDFDGSPPL